MRTVKRRKAMDACVGSRRVVGKPAPSPQEPDGEQTMEGVSPDDVENDQPTSTHKQNTEDTEDGGDAGGSGRAAQEMGNEDSDYGDDGDEEPFNGGSEGSSDLSDQELEGDEFAGVMDDEFADGLDEEDEQGDEDADGEDEDADGEDKEGGSKRDRSRSVPYKFLEGDKSASFAKAFAKIVEKKVKATPEAGDTEATVSKADGADILMESKDVAKRKAEELEAAKVNRIAKKLRLEMRRRGHAKVTKKGQDPAADQKEKQLVSLATRGVVLLFNAVAKAQKARQESGGGKGGKAGKLSKASFLTQLKGAAAAADGSRAKAAGGVLGLGTDGAQGTAGASGWQVLQQDFTGVQGSSKMKDWDKEQSDSDGGGAPEKIDVASDDDNGW